MPDPMFVIRGLIGRRHVVHGRLPVGVEVDNEVVDPDGIDWSAFLGRGAITNGDGDKIGVPLSIEEGHMTAAIDPSFDGLIEQIKSSPTTTDYRELRGPTLREALERAGLLPAEVEVEERTDGTTLAGEG